MLVKLSRSRKVGPHNYLVSGQTMERLGELVLSYLSSEQRFSLLSQVLPSKPYNSIRINVKEPVGGCAELDSALASMQHYDVLAHVPEKVMQAASWLYDDDITAARGMLAEAERRENDIILASATREVALLKRTIQSGQVKSASYSVQMPAATYPSWLMNPLNVSWLPFVLVVIAMKF